jgi:hypothetical protein
VVPLPRYRGADKRSRSRGAFFVRAEVVSQRFQTAIAAISIFVRSIRQWKAGSNTIRHGELRSLD